MAFTSTLSTKEPRTFSIGPLKVEFWTWGAASGDTSGVVTTSSMSEVFHATIDGLGKGQSAAPVCSGKTATFSFADPVATVGGTVILYGR